MHDELLWRLTEPEDPEVEAREQHILEVFLKRNPRMREKLTEEALLTEARAALREVLACRQLAVSQDDEARIEACTDLAVLKRWHRQAITAPTMADALR